MKSSLKLFGIIAFVVVIGFSMAACGDSAGDDSGGDDGIISGIDTLVLSGNVFKAKWNDDDTITYTDYTGPNLAVSSDCGGSGTITNGILNFSIGTPVGDSLDDLEDHWPFSDFYENVTTARAAVINILRITGSHGDLEKKNITSRPNNNGYSYTDEYVTYVFVESDIRISGTGGTFTGTYTTDTPTIATLTPSYTYTTPQREVVTGTETTTSSSFSFTLKAGWNSVNTKIEGSYKVTEGTRENPIRTSDTYTVTLSLANPSLRWILYE